MKTVKIHESLHRALKIRAAESGVDLQELTEHIIRKGLETTAQKPVSQQKDATKKDQGAAPKS